MSSEGTTGPHVEVMAEAHKPIETAAEDRAGNTTNIVGKELELDSSGIPSSELAEGYISAGTSLTSSTTNYRFEHGRRYHAYKDGIYNLPNDEQEANRLELQHHIWYITFNGKLHLAPVPKKVEQVLDVGCGTGAWAIDFATAYPDSQVLGTDLSPIQPTNIPENCHFLIDDATADWAFGRQFNYIHVRTMTVGISDWTRFFEQSWNNLQPGGWLELQEWIGPLRCDDGSCPPDCTLMQWANLMREAAAKAGIDFNAATRFSSQLQDQGFVNVQEIRGKWAIGTWPKGKREKKIGEMFRRDLHDGVDGGSMRFFSNQLGWSADRIRTYLDEVKKELFNADYHLYMPIYIVLGQKPT